MYDEVNGTWDVFRLEGGYIQYTGYYIGFFLDEEDAEEYVKWKNEKKE